MNKGKVIGIISFKGGVGKTVSAVNIASSLAKQNKSVVVIDSNFTSPNLHVHLGMLEDKPNLTHVMTGQKEIKDVIYQHKSGIHFIPSSFFFDKINLNKFRDSVRSLKDDYEYVIVDSSPSMNDEMIAALMASDELIFITTPDYPTLLATMKAAQVAKEKNLPVKGIIINKKRNRNFELLKADIEKAVSLPVIAELDDSVKMLQAGSKFTPLVDFAPKSRNAKEYQRIAQFITGETQEKVKSISFLTKFKNWFNKSGYFAKFDFNELFKKK
jgi:MinD-like ATPase involved in chromosome partitioning or flagellar assembly